MSLEWGRGAGVRRRTDVSGAGALQFCTKLLRSFSSFMSNANGSSCAKGEGLSVGVEQNAPFQAKQKNAPTSLREMLSWTLEAGPMLEMMELSAPAACEWRPVGGECCMLPPGSGGPWC